MTGLIMTAIWLLIQKILIVEGLEGVKTGMRMVILLKCAVVQTVMTMIPL
jgi:hypothetical protein